MQDRSIDIRLPYVAQAENAYSGRTLDERVVNPFLHRERIPCSKGPYLSVFRRSVRFDESTREGVRDKPAFDAFLVCVEYLATTNRQRALEQFLVYLLYRFVQLREENSVELHRIQRFSLEQYKALIETLVAIPSGGRFPLFLVESTFSALKLFARANWEIRHQGINVADGASGASGDVTIVENGTPLLTVEITERVVDKARVVSTFNTKIGPNSLENYLFITTPPGPDREALDQSYRYFAQGHEISFIDLVPWVVDILATVGMRGRDEFNRRLIEHLDRPEIPQSMKVGWNTSVAAVISS